MPVLQAQLHKVLRRARYQAAMKSRHAQSRDSSRSRHGAMVAANLKEIESMQSKFMFSDIIWKYRNTAETAGL